VTAALPPPGFLSRGDLPRQVAAELHDAGLAVVQGPAGSGATWIARAAAAEFGAPLVFVQAGLRSGLYDLAAPLGLTDDPTLLRGPRDAAVDAVLDRLRRRPVLWLIDDLDAGVGDGDLDLLLAAIDAGELAGTGSAVLVTTHTDLAVPRRPVHPLPPLSEADAATLAGQPVPPAWRRRPLALRLLPAGVDLLPGPPVAAAVGAATAGLSRDARELLGTAAAVGHSISREVLLEAAATDDDALLDVLLNAGLLIHDAGVRCPRGVAAEVLASAEQRLPGWRPATARLRVAGGWLRDGVATGAHHDLVAAEPARMALRLAARAGDGRFATQAALHGGATAAADAAGALRPLREDLRLVFEAPAEDLPALDAARLAFALARCHGALQEHGAAGRVLAAGLPAAEVADDPELLRSMHTALGARLLQSGDPREALPHLRAARALARGPAAESDAENLLAAAALKLGRLDEAERRYDRALTLAEGADDARRAASRRAGLAAVLLKRGRLRDAHEAIAAAADQAEALGDAAGLAHRRLNEALVQSLRGDPRAASRTLHQLVTSGAPLAPRTAARMHTLRAGLRRLAGDLDGAGRDLAAAAEATPADGDREAEADRLAEQGRVAATAGRWVEAVEAFDAAIAAEPPGDPVGHAARTLERIAAAAWADADASEPLPSARDVRALVTAIPEEPLLPARLAAEQRQTEIELLRATTEGTAPLFALRRVRQLRHRCEADPDRLDCGEPALRLLEAWADRLCGGTDEARALAQRAALDGATAGLATVAAQAEVLLGRPPPAWSGPARLLTRLLSPGLRSV